MASSVFFRGERPVTVQLKTQSPPTYNIGQLTYTPESVLYGLLACTTASYGYHADSWMLVCGPEGIHPLFELHTSGASLARGVHP